ncbi:ATP-binding protein [Agromyces bauzanensis]
MTHDATARRVSGAATPVRATVPALQSVFGRVRGIRHPLVLIDGPSGAGKSTFADAVRAAWPGGAPALVRLDDVYPGWSGLERAGAVLARSLVPPVRRGGVGSWRRWDWARARPGALERLRPGGPLIVEGCGAFVVGDGAPGALRVWVDAPDAMRKRRALDRDDGAYDPFWELWEHQWRRYVHRTSPERRADLHVRAVPVPAPR